MLEGMDVAKERLEVLTVDVTGTVSFRHHIRSVLMQLRAIDIPVHQGLTGADEGTVADAAARCKDRFGGAHLRLAFAIPGILHPERSPAQIDYRRALETFQVNTLGPMLLMKHFCPFLPRKTTELTAEDGLPGNAVFAVMSARVGSITDNRAGGWYSYRSSKAAVNQIVKSLDIHLRSNAGEKAMAIALHPGTVKTGLSRNFWETTPIERLFSPEFSAEKLIDVVKGMTVQGRGRCWDWEGREIPP